MHLVGGAIFRSDTANALSDNMETLIGAARGDAGPSPIKDGDTAGFAVDVIEASMEVPVIVDFWAPWCGPCKQLGPTLEKVVTAARGAVRLVKIDIDKNQELAAQLHIQSIPTVFAFYKGRPADAFQGALPESQVKAWVDKLVKTAGSEVTSPVEEALVAAKAALEQGDIGSASALFGQVIAREPQNTQAVAGLARCHIQSGQVDKARALLAAVAAEIADNTEIQSARSALELAEEGAAAAGQLGGLQRAVAADGADLRARYDLAVALFGAGQAEQAVDELLEVIRRDRNWNEQAARQQLLKVFDSLGPTNSLTIDSRRRLSSLLFS